MELAILIATFAATAALAYLGERLVLSLLFRAIHRKS